MREKEISDKMEMQGESMKQEIVKSRKVTPGDSREYKEGKKR